MSKTPAGLLARLAFCATLLSVLPGCTSTTIATDPLKLQPNAAMKPVVLSVTANTGEIRGFDKVTVQRLTEAQLQGLTDRNYHYDLLQVAPGLSRDTAFFVGALPAGQYRLVSFSDSKTMKYLHIPGNTKLLGHFVVKGDKPVDLGRLVMTPMNTKVVYGRSMNIASNRPLLQRFAPEYAALLAGDVDSGWMPVPADGPQPGEVEAYALARPVGASCVSELPDGSVVAASRLGSVLIRSHRGGWRTLRGPGIESLVCVLPVKESGTTLVAMGEFGTLLRKPEGVEKLVPVDTGDLPAGNILRLYGSEADGWTLALQRGTDVILYQSAKLEAGKWTEVRKESVAFSVWHGVSDFHSWPTKEGFAYTTAAGPFHFYNQSTKAWTQQLTPQNHRITGINASLNDDILALTSPGGGFGGAFAGVFMSRDKAQSWQELTVPFKVKASTPVLAQDGTLLMAGGVFGDPELQGSKDNGVTWSHLGAYELGRVIVPLKSGGLVDYDMGQWGIFTLRYSGDGGKTWEVEYSNFDSAAYRAMQKK